MALAAKLALEPKALILDEPTSNLDPQETEEVLATVDRIRSLVELERGGIRLGTIPLHGDELVVEMVKLNGSPPTLVGRADSAGRPAAARQVTRLRN